MLAFFNVECESTEKCDQDFSICLPRRKCVGENSCDVTDYCDEHTNFCLPRRRCKRIGECNEHEVCKRITEEKYCMPAKKCDRNGHCIEDFYHIENHIESEKFLKMEKN